MSCLTRYILRQLAAPFAVTAFTLSGVIWLIQSLRYLYVILEQGKSAGVFLQLTVLTLPTVLAVVLPVALLCAVLYTLNRLQADSELVVMFAAGLSRWSVTQPVLLFAGAVAAAVLVLNLYLTPVSLQTLRDRLFEIRTGLISFIISPGRFTNPVPGVTVFIGGRGPGGAVHDLLIQDDRDPARPVVYMSRHATLAQSPQGLRLIMQDGNIQYGGANADAESLNILYFDEYAYDASQLVETPVHLPYEAKEMFLLDLLNPDMSDPYARLRAREFLTQGHDRLSAPLYCFVYALMALAALGGAGGGGRQGLGLQIMAAACLAVAARLCGLWLLSAAVAAPALIPLLYLLPLGICALAATAMRERGQPAAQAA